MSKTVAIIGRGKSGTRIPMQLLAAGDAHIGRVINASFDKTPFTKLYDAVKMLGPHVEANDRGWDFTELLKCPVPQHFKDLMLGYLDDTLSSSKAIRAWKLPESILGFPWLVRMFPDFHYIFWYRHPIGILNKPHATDDLRTWHIESPKAETVQEQRARSWLYQWQIVHCTPKPKRFLAIRYEDYLSSPETICQQIEHFIGAPIGRGVVRKSESVAKEIPFSFLMPALRQAGYL
jgi:hypothetical protein